MKYIVMLLMFLLLTSCISNNSSGINAAMGLPEMLIDGDLKPHTLMGVATAKRKTTVPVVSDEDSYNTPTKPTPTSMD